MSKVITTNSPYNPDKEEIAGSMLIVSDKDLQNAYNLLTKAAEDSGYTKISSVEIKIHNISEGLIYLIYGTPVKPITWQTKQ